MKKFVYTILDEKAESIGSLFVCHSDEEAIRIVHGSMPAESLPRRYPADFSLLRVCTIDLESAAVSLEGEGEHFPFLVARLDSIFAEKA